MSKTHCRFCEKTYEGLYLRCPACNKWLAPSPEPPMSPRTDIGELDYQRAKDEGGSVPLELAPSIRTWEHWRLIENNFPYGVLYKEHQMLLPKRAGVAERFDLNDAEKQEFEQILKNFVYPEYDVWFENCPKRRSMNHIYHVHVASYYDSRGSMSL